jgi:hypothetical protein
VSKSGPVVYPVLFSLLLVVALVVGCQGPPRGAALDADALLHRYEADPAAVREMVGTVVVVRGVIVGIHFAKGDLNRQICLLAGPRGAAEALHVEFGHGEYFEAGEEIVAAGELVIDPGTGTPKLVRASLR